MQRCKDAKMQRCKDAKMQRCKDAKMQYDWKQQNITLIRVTRIETLGHNKTEIKPVNACFRKTGARPLIKMAESTTQTRKRRESSTSWL